MLKPRRQKALGFRPFGVVEENPPPTPEEIREACLLIQAEWTDKEREARMAPLWRPRPWVLPGVSLPVSEDSL